MKRTVKSYFSLLFAVFIFLVGLVFIYFITQNSVIVDPDNSEYSQLEVKESCLNCHNVMTGFSPFHDPKKIGCASCHLGNIESADKDIAHQNMVLIPGNLSDVENTCGKCHVKEMEKVNQSLMTTNSGIVAVDKFIFGEADSPDLTYHIKELQFSAADKHLRDLCANCHLGAPKSEFGKIDQLSRGGGCVACHLNYSQEAEKALDNYLSNSENLPKIHPSIDVKMSNNHCYGCHSRSSRISTNYEGWHETLLENIPQIENQNFKRNQDGRIYSFQGEDVHHKGGMLCIDCHTSHEVMGDGKTYLHEENAVKIECADCHFKDEPQTVTYAELDTESYFVWMHREYQHKDKKMLKKRKGGEPLINTFLDDEKKAFLIGKENGKLFPINKQPSICANDLSHQNMSCSTCHAQWAPKCIGCHNSFDPNDPQGYDLLDKKFVKGQWIEHVFEFETDMPALGVRTTIDERKIEPAIPGMIMTIDHQSFDDEKINSFHRLYAPNSPHTTSAKSRSCISCHANPVALGYGKGKLTYNVTNGKGNWHFDPAYALNENDGLPEDAWIPFLKNPSAKTFSTRTDFKPFSVDEQKSLLTVGACLQCHQPETEQIKGLLKNGLKNSLKNLDERCILPFKSK
ncbi:hypothetical protein [Namhaeicola litoreus]|uniref:Uncharacterized protein n=1 Tax=Namhaeicola litoreus TaxID=1052145 RepID=A0ABW3Y4I0_9FLAO